MQQRGKTIVNLVCSIMVLLTNIVIGFWLSPFIVENVGVEANGFVTLSSNFVTYAQLIVTALNSMAARFITLAYMQKDYKRANLYYNSVFWGNLIIVAVLIVPAIILIARFEYFLDVPPDILKDVKLLFTFVFFNFFLTTGFPNWDCGTYITNRLDRTYLPQVFTSVFRCVFLFVVLSFVSQKVYIVGLASTIVTVFGLAVAGYNTHTLTPELKIVISGRKPLVSGRIIVELVGAGVWNSISNVGNMLLSGLDLLICNIFIGAESMGILSLAKTLPHYMQMFSSSITSAFAPEMMLNYAKGDMDALLKDINRAMKITSVLLIVPLAGIVAMGEAFFALWVPAQDAHLLSLLSMITCMGYAFTSGTQILYNVFSVTNHVKPNALLMMLSGVVSTLVVFILLKTTNLGVFAVAGVSPVVCWFRNMFYTVPYTAKYLGYKKTQFYPQVVNCFLSTVLLSLIGRLIVSYFTINSWGKFLVVACIVGSVCLAVNLFIFLKKEDRKFLFDKISRKLQRKRI